VVIVGCVKKKKLAGPNAKTGEHDAFWDCYYYEDRS
jgi:hypothetical protein